MLIQIEKIIKRFDVKEKKIHIKYILLPKINISHLITKNAKNPRSSKNFKISISFPSKPKFSYSKVRDTVHRAAHSKLLP